MGKADTLAIAISKDLTKPEWQRRINSGRGNRWRFLVATDGHRMHLERSTAPAPELPDGVNLSGILEAANGRHEIDVAPLVEPAKKWTRAKRRVLVAIAPWGIWLDWTASDKIGQKLRAEFFAASGGAYVIPIPEPPPRPNLAPAVNAAYLLDAVKHARSTWVHFFADELAPIMVGDAHAERFAIVMPTRV